MIQKELNKLLKNNRIDFVKDSNDTVFFKHGYQRALIDIYNLLRRRKII